MYSNPNYYHMYHYHVRVCICSYARRIKRLAIFKTFHLIFRHGKKGKSLKESSTFIVILYWEMSNQFTHSTRQPQKAFHVVAVQFTASFIIDSL